MRRMVRWAGQDRAFKKNLDATEEMALSIMDPGTGRKRQGMDNFTVCIQRVGGWVDV